MVWEGLRGNPDPYPDDCSSNVVTAVSRESRQESSRTSIAKVVPPRSMAMPIKAAIEFLPAPFDP